MGYGKLDSWGWCGEDCPLKGYDDSTWGTDETLTVTTYEEFDINYIAVAILTGTFISIPLIATALKRYGMYFIEYDVLSQCLTSDKLVSRVIRKVIRWNNGRLGFEARLISFLGKLTRYEIVGALLCYRPY